MCLSVCVYFSLYVCLVGDVKGADKSGRGGAGGTYTPKTGFPSSRCVLEQRPLRSSKSVAAQQHKAQGEKPPSRKKSASSGSGLPLIDHRFGSVGIGATSEGNKRCITSTKWKVSIVFVSELRSLRHSQSRCPDDGRW